MKTLLRWGKFNLVGVAGMAVQLVALAALNRAIPGHYLAASATALEITLLHNFAAHVRFTWRDRRDSSSWRAQLARFHLSNGLVSLLGNLALTRVLVEEARLPVVLANAIAILCCSVVNFYLGDFWAFAASAKTARAGRDAAGSSCSSSDCVNAGMASCFPRSPNRDLGHPPSCKSRSVPELF